MSDPPTSPPAGVPGTDDPAPADAPTPAAPGHHHFGHVADGVRGAVHEAGALGGSVAHEAATIGAAAAAQTVQVAGAVRLEVTPTGLTGARALAGHALGLHLLIPAEGIHGPREAPALLYVFADALAIRPTDDAPMSAVPLYGLHILLPHVAVARWAYRAGRTAHANLDLARDDEAVEASLATWTVDDFADADDKLTVAHVADITGPVHLYRHLGFVRLSVEVAGRRTLQLKSAMPETDAPFEALWNLVTRALGPGVVVLREAPARSHDEPPATAG